MPPMRPKSPPGRPPLPSGNVTPKHTPKAGVISIAPKHTENNNTNESKPNVPHRPAPTVNASQSYPQCSDLPGPFSRSSSSSSTPSPSNEPHQSMPSVRSLSIHDQDTGAIYEEINDDVVSL